MPSLGTSVGGNATVGTLATIGHADTVQFAAGAVPQALYQLPADISDFVGRVELQAELLAHFRGASAPVGVAGPRIALYGPAGVGKSALAVRVAHSIADIFPDAQLYIDLGAGAGKPVAAMDALASFLRALGVEGPYPDSLDERSSTFRAHLAAMRALIVLDNAGTLEQVTPLLPGASTCAVIVTSRRSLGALEGALSRNVELLDRDNAIVLLSELAGSARVDAEPQAAHEIVRHCGCLPLAIRIAGARLRNLPGRSVSWLADRLADEHTRLDELDLGDKAIRTSLAVSHNELSPEESEMFCLLAALPGPDFSTALAAGAAEMDEPSTERLLDHLVETQLLNATTSEDRFQLHDLVHLFASEQLDHSHTLARRTIADRAGVWLRDHAYTAAVAIEADASGRTAALAWFEAELESLVTAIEVAYEAGNWDTATTIAFYLNRFFSIRGYWDEWARTGELALESSRHADNSASEAMALNNLAQIYVKLARWINAIAADEEALAIWRQLNNRRGQGQTLNKLGIAYWQQADQDKAIVTYEQALAIWRELGDRHGEGETLNNLGVVFGHLERWDDAIAYYEQDLAICRELGDHHGEGQTLNNLGVVYRRLERWDDAIANYEQALAIYRELGDHHGEGQTLNNLGVLSWHLERWDDAIAYYEQDLAICRELGDHHGESQTLNNLAIARQRLRTP
jgi:tetratricopeptide (TPR) repeat protein